MFGYHITLKHDIHGLKDLTLYDVEGVACVEHAEGLVQKERPHYHIWVPHDTLPTAYEVDKKRKELRSHYLTLAPHLSGLNGNALYAVIAHNNYDNWKEYVIREKCKKPKVIFWNRPDPAPEFAPPDQPPDALILPALDVDAPVAVVKEKKKDPAYKRFETYCNELVNPTIDEVIEHWTSWTQGNHEMHRVQGPIRYVYYSRTTDPIQKARIKDTMNREIHDRFFSHY